MPNEHQLKPESDEEQGSAPSTSSTAILDAKLSTTPTVAGLAQALRGDATVQDELYADLLQRYQPAFRALTEKDQLPAAELPSNADESALLLCALLRIFLEPVQPQTAQRIQPLAKIISSRKRLAKFRHRLATWIVAFFDELVATGHEETEEDEGDMLVDVLYQQVSVSSGKSTSGR